jgi:CheY-like chemotaxis protein
LIDDNTSERPTCMVVDDDPAIVRTLQWILGNRRIGPSEFRNVEDVVAACEQNAPELLFLDIALRGFDAIEVIRALGDRRYGGPIVLISGLHALIQDVARGRAPRAAHAAAARQAVPRAPGAGDPARLHAAAGRSRIARARSGTFTRTAPAGHSAASKRVFRPKPAPT